MKISLKTARIIFVSIACIYYLVAGGFLLYHLYTKEEKPIPEIGGHAFQIGMEAPVHIDSLVFVRFHFDLDMMRRSSPDWQEVWVEIDRLEAQQMRCNGCKIIEVRLTSQAGGSEHITFKEFRKRFLTRKA